jgi:dGTPase
LSPAIDEIIDFSVKHIYQSREVTQKEIAGYQILNELLDFFTNAIERINKGKATNLDQLVARSFLKDLNYENEDTADWLINCCSFVASLTDGEAVRIHRKLKGNHIER